MTIQRIECVRPLSPTSMSIRCTTSDRVVRHTSVPVLFFYDRQLDAVELAHGLSRVLSDFSPFSGRLTHRGREMFLNCNDTGVSFSVARQDIDRNAALERLATGSKHGLVESIGVKPAFSMGGPLLTARLTLFADGTSCLGMCWHHSVGDMHSFMQLMRAWSCSVAGNAYTKPLVVEDRVTFLERALPVNAAKPGLRRLGMPEMCKTAFYLARHAPSLRAAYFYFSPSEQEAIRTALQRESGIRLSTNDALCGHMFSQMVGRTPDRVRKLSIAVEYRKRMALPEMLIGNMVSSVSCPRQASDSPSQLASALRGELDNFSDHHMDYRANEQFMRDCESWRVLPKAVDPLSESLFVTNWCKFGVYEIDFGGDAPAYFTGPGVPFPWLAGLWNGPGGHGSIFAATLPSAVAARLTSDAGLSAVHAFRDSTTDSNLPAPQLSWLN